MPRQNALSSGALPPGATASPPALTYDSDPHKPRGALKFHSDDPGDEFGPPSLRSESQTTGTSQSTADAHVPGSTQTGLVLFRVVHKHLSAMKRPLASVDNLQHGDIAIKTYTAADISQGAGRPKLSVDERSSGVLLIRFLEGAGFHQDIIKNVKAWKRETHDAFQIQLGQAVEPEDEQLLLDMMAARAFVGSGRSFQVYGSDKNWKALARLSELDLVVKATSPSNRRCSIRESSRSSADQSSLSNARQSSPSNASHAQVVDLLSEEEDTRTLEGEWCLTSKAVSVFKSRLQLGSPSLVFSVRPDMALQDRTTFELYLHVTALGFQEMTDPSSSRKASQKPYTPKRGRGDSSSWASRFMPVDMLPVVTLSTCELLIVFMMPCCRLPEGVGQLPARLPAGAGVLQSTVFPGLPGDPPWSTCCLLSGSVKSSR